VDQVFGSNSSSTSLASAPRAVSPVIILLSSENFSTPLPVEASPADFHLWTVSGAAGPSDLGAALTAVREFELRARPADPALEGAAHE